MRRILLILFIICVSFKSFAQSEFLNKSNSFGPIKPNLSAPTTATPSVFKLHTKPQTSTSKSIVEENKLQFTNLNDFKNPNDIYKEKLNKKSGEDESNMFRSNQYLGDFKSKSSFVNIS